MNSLTKYITLLLVCAFGALADGPPDVGIAPKEPPPPGCVKDYDGVLSFLTHPETNEMEQATKVTLKKGILVDSAGRIGSIVANKQFQFDGPPPQAGAIYTGGFSKCENGTLAIGGTTDWWYCNSGSFDNLYSEKIGEQCRAGKVFLADANPKTRSTSTVASSTVSSSVGSTSATVTGSASLTQSSSVLLNGTVSSVLSGSRTLSPSITSAQPPATSAAKASTSRSTGAAAVATFAPRPETLGAVIGILGAALFL